MATITSPTSPTSADRKRIRVRAKNRVCEFDATAGESILFAGLRCGVALPYECATGTCGTCKARCLEGSIAETWPDAPGRKSLVAARGDFLMCQSVARSDVDIEITRSIDTLPAACPATAIAGTITGLRALTEDVAAFDVGLDANCDFEAGQFMAVGAPGVEGMRGYSMVNYARNGNRLEFLAKRKPEGRFTGWLFGGRAEGARLALFGPLGKATFHPGTEKNILCIAGGSGIAGMMSILSRARGERHFERYRGHVFFGVRTMRDTFFLSELARHCGEFPSTLSITVALSDEDVPTMAQSRHPRLRFARGLVHEVAKREMAGNYQNVRAYLAGPPPAVDASIRLLLSEARLPATEIRYDKFS